MLVSEHMARIDMQSFAKMGAEARLRQLDQERAEILAAFPELGGRASGTPRGGCWRVGRAGRRTQAPAPETAHDGGSEEGSLGKNEALLGAAPGGNG
jgi:hypothetical protein